MQCLHAYDLLVVLRWFHVLSLNDLFVNTLLAAAAATHVVEKRAQGLREIAIVGITRLSTVVG